MAAKDEAKSVRISANTHAKLLILSTAFNKTISDLIDDLLEKAYPEIMEETDKVMKSMELIRQRAEGKGDQGK